MKRATVTPAVLPTAALAELKEWLGITSAQDDAPLGNLLRAALDLCEDFTGQVPLAATFEELLPTSGDWQRLATGPVLAITQVEGVPADGARFALAASAYEIDIDAGGVGKVRVLSPGSAGRAAVRFSAGLAASWTALPEGLRQGVIRLAAHQHRARDDDRAGPVPPSAVAALWRPWRRLRLT